MKKWCCTHLKDVEMLEGCEECERDSDDDSETVEELEEKITDLQEEIRELGREIDRLNDINWDQRDRILELERRLDERI